MTKWKKTYVLHLLGNAYPSRPGLIEILTCVTLQERHCIAIFVAFALTPDAETIMPGTLTSLETISGYKSKRLIWIYISNCCVLHMIKQ